MMFRCKFGNCKHMDDAGCAVREEWKRHPWYVELLQVRPVFTQGDEGQDKLFKGFGMYGIILSVAHLHSVIGSMTVVRLCLE